MPPRLTESYHPGDLVEIYLAGDDEEQWCNGEVVALQHPGVWVLTFEDRRLWYVTNGRRIRPHDDTQLAAS
jgi:hypothetical protein